MTEKDEVNDNINVDDFPLASSYVVPSQKTVKELLETDNNDESLKRYKEKLLEGSSSNEIVIVEPNNLLNVIIKKLSVVVNGTVMDSINLPADKEFTIKIKEGSQYKIQFEFFVQREIVTGLKYLHKVTRHGFRVATELYMLGSYGPRKEIYVYNSPIEEAPTGYFSRDKYRVRSLITDDDKNTWLAWVWFIEITKDETIF